MGKPNNKSTLNSTSLIEEFYNENSLEITQDTDLNRTIICIFKEIKVYEEHTDKLIKELEGENDKLWKEVEILKESQDKMEREIKHSSSQHKRKGEYLSNRMDEAKNRILRLEDKMEELECSRKDYEKFKKKNKSGIIRNYGTP